jgi:RimJ/RimL family protein N-acetyltransferase
MAILLATAKLRANLRRVQLTVFTGNSRAIRLYRSFGLQFEELHQSFSRQGNDYVDAYSMTVVSVARSPAGPASRGEGVNPGQRKAKAS